MRFLAQEEIPDQHWLGERTPAGVTLLCSAYLDFQYQKRKVSCTHFILSCIVGNWIKVRFLLVLFIAQRWKLSKLAAKNMS